MDVGSQQGMPWVPHPDCLVAVAVSWRATCIAVPNHVIFQACHPEVGEGSAFCGGESRSFTAFRMTVINGRCEQYDRAAQRPGVM